MGGVLLHPKCCCWRYSMLIHPNLSAALRRELRRKPIGLFVVPLKGLFREYPAGIRVPFSLFSDGPDLVVPCLILPRPVESRPSLRRHLLGVLVAVELEALLGRTQVQILVAFLVHGSLQVSLSSSALYRRLTLLQLRLSHLDELLFLAANPSPIAYVRVLVEVSAAYKPEQLVDVVGRDARIACQPTYRLEYFIVTSTWGTEPEASEDVFIVHVGLESRDRGYRYATEA